jgi:hypothetical protein
MQRLLACSFFVRYRAFAEITGEAGAVLNSGKFPSFEVRAFHGQ